MVVFCPVMLVMSISVGLVAAARFVDSATVSDRMVSRVNIAVTLFVLRPPIVMPRVNYLLLSETTQKTAPALT